MLNFNINIVDKKILNKINDLKKNNLLVENSKILIAFSGGPDSVFLYYLLKFLQQEYKLTLGLVYVNHNLRTDTDNDIIFVNEFSKKENIKLFITSVDVKKYSLDNKISIETAARELRYSEIFKIMNQNKYDYIATGHNFDDNIETFVFRMLRGTSLRGLKSIPEKRDNIIRPILNFEKKEIINILKQNNLKYIIDYTNKENEYTRNFIRNEIFPLFERVNSNFKEKISYIIEDIKNIELNKNDKYNIEKNKFISLLEEKNVKINKNKIEKIFNKLYDIDGNIRTNGTKKFYLGNGKILYNEYGKKVIIDEKELNYDLDSSNLVNNKKQLIENETINWKGHEISLKIIKKEENNSYIKFENNKENQCFFVKQKEEGDKIYKEKVGSQKLKKLFIDKKIPIKDRNDIPIIVYRNEENERIIIIGDIYYSSDVKIIKSFIENEKKYFFDKYEITIRRKNGIK